VEDRAAVVVSSCNLFKRMMLVNFGIYAARLHMVSEIKTSRGQGISAKDSELISAERLAELHDAPNHSPLGKAIRARRERIDTSGVCDADDNFVDNIIVNDFDSIKHRIERQINGHRIDLVIGVLHVIIEEMRHLKIKMEKHHAE
jgi:hypothetical protein